MDVVDQVLVDQVLIRLERIERLRCDVEDQRTGATALLAELRELVGEAEAWARAEGDGRAKTAVEKLREGAEGMR